jgi:hypothetical protein
MDTSTVISIGGTFLKYVGEVLAEVKRQDLANIDAEFLRLKRNVLSERLEQFKADLDVAVKQKRASVEQDLISRGFSNSTVRQSTLRVVESDAMKQVERVTCEYNRAIEEIALIERSIEIRNRPPWWKKVLRAFGLYRS